MQYDIIIAGGGLAGLTLTSRLSERGFSVLLIDAVAPEKAMRAVYDGRTTAISYGSHHLLAAAKLWPVIEAWSCPIEHIKIFDGNSPLLMEFRSDETGGHPFGYIIENRHLRSILIEHVRSLPNVEFLAPEKVVNVASDAASITVGTLSGKKHTAGLLIAADGKESSIRALLDIPAHGWAYDQTALVAVVAHEKPHQNAAIEHFRSDGPFAVLPMPDQDDRHFSSLVWTLAPDIARRYQNCDTATFEAAVNARFPESHGRAKLSSGRFCYPLGLKHARAYRKQRVVLIAEAAHAMHPIAGQGLNMGMRDIAALSDILSRARDNGQDIGADDVLRRYEDARRPDNTAMMGATDMLNILFSNDHAVLRRARRLGVRAVAAMPPVKSFFMRQAMGLAGLPVTDQQKKILR